MALTRTLLTNHWISAPAALAALDRYAETRASIGRLALSEGMLEMGPLLHILDEQLGEASIGSARRFGEIAVELGYLDEVQVAALLEAQSEVSPSFEEILLDLGAVPAVPERDDQVPFAEAPPRVSP